MGVELGKVRLGNLLLDGTPRVAVGFTDLARPSDIADAKDAGVDVAEIRVDQFKNYEASYVQERLTRFTALPTLATIRLENEGGSWRGSESARQALYETVIPHVNAVDVELQTRQTLDAVRQHVKRLDKRLVVSFHDTTTTPSYGKLEQVVRESESAGADIIKIATMVTERSHVSRLANLLIQHSDKNVIVIGMGAKGLVTRLFFPALGSLLTFAAIAGQPTAPGQLPYRVMMDMLREMYPAYNEEKIISLQLMECI